MKKRIAIVDDNHFLLKALEEKLQFFEDLDLRYSAKSGKEIVEKIQKKPNIDVILMDIEMPEMNGIEATYQIKQKFPQIKIIMLTVFDNDENIFNAIRAGADGYLLKDTTPENLHKGILETLEGGAAMSPTIARKTLSLLRNPEKSLLETNDEIQLSSREIDVLEQLATGNSYKKIAEALFISPSTARKHIENIYKKLQVHNKLEAIEKAKNNNLI